MKIFYSAFIFLFVSLALQAQTTKDEYFIIKETGYYWKTKIDSTSEYSVINSSRIVVFNGTIPISKNIGREINFAVTNEKGEKKTINSKVGGTTTFSGEEKYLVELTFDYNGTEKKTKVILADLSTNEQKLIAGKNWIK